MSGPRLEVVDSVGRRVVVIDKPLFTIGRRSANDLALTGNDVSREHAEIRHADNQYVICDRGSRCGTTVNGARSRASVGCHMRIEELPTHTTAPAGGGSALSARANARISGASRSGSGHFAAPRVASANASTNAKKTPDRRFE